MATPLPPTPAPFADYATLTAGALLAPAASAQRLPSGGQALAGALQAAAVQVRSAAGDATLSAVAVPAPGGTPDALYGELGQPIAMLAALVAALTAAAATGSPTAPLATAASQTAMRLSAELARLRIAASLSATNTLQLLATSVLAGPAAVGAVGTPEALAPVTAP